MKLSPELLTFDDGSAVHAGSWPRRRRELYDAIINHEFGGMPPEHEGVDVILRASSDIRNWPGIQYRTHDVRTRFADGGEVCITLSLWRPPGDGPFPVLLDGDGCWRYFNDGVIQKVLERGCIAAVFDRTEAAADNKDVYRDTGLYRLFPAAEFGVCSAWAWAFHRCVDALVDMDDVRADAIAVTGHSRGGKAALLGGATDARIAVTNPNNSGIGGAGLNRLKMEGSEVVGSFFRSGNIFWFGKGFADYRNRDAELPYDNHFLLALVAPRRLLLTEAYEDTSANPAGTYSAALAAGEVYDLLGSRENIGWAYRERGHSHTPEDYMALLDFMDRHLRGSRLKRDFQRQLYPELDNLLSAPIAD